MAAPDFVLDANVRSPTYYAARTAAPCPHCVKATRLLAMAMPVTHQTLDVDAPGAGEDTGDGLSSGTWQRADAVAFLFYVQQVSDGVQHRLHELSRHFRLARSEASQNTYWANHCEHCGTLLGDHELHCEPGGAFAPSSKVFAAKIELLHINAPFQATASGYALEPEFLRHMRRS